MLLIGGLSFVIARVVPSGKVPERGNCAPLASDKAYAFANASDISVFDDTALTGGRKEHFEFGDAYEVLELKSGYAKLKLPTGDIRYVRCGDVTIVSTPRWLATSTGFNKSEREFIRFWEQKAVLEDFLSGTNNPRSRWDYEEVMGSTPNFALRLPLIATESVDHGISIVGATKLALVMLPVSRQVQRAFERARRSFAKQVDLFLLVDVSGSTAGFVEPLMSALADAMLKNETLRSRVDTIRVVTFGVSRTEKMKIIGKLTSKDLIDFQWHRTGIDWATNGEREPLVDGLVAITKGFDQTSDNPRVLVVLSGADVELTSYIAAESRLATLGAIDIGAVGRPTTIFAQITPEPSQDLINASKQFHGGADVTYLEYSDVIVDRLVASILKASESIGSNVQAADALGALAKTAHDQRMLAVAPRLLTPTSKLPDGPMGGDGLDWYAVYLWCAVDELIWQEATR
jgi:hypothetical protein